MRFMYAASGFAQNDTESQTDFVNNVSGDPIAGPAPAEEPFNAQWIEVTNHGAEILLANPYGSIDGGRVGVVIREDETYRFEVGERNRQALDANGKPKSGWPSIWLLSTAGGTTATITAGTD